MAAAYSGQLVFEMQQGPGEQSTKRRRQDYAYDKWFAFSFSPCPSPHFPPHLSSVFTFFSIFSSLYEVWGRFAALVKCLDQSIAFRCGLASSFLALPSHLLPSRSSRQN